MLALRAILTTIGLVLSVLCVVLLVLAADWLLASFNIDRLLAIIGIVISSASFLFALVIYSRRRH